MQFEWDPKKAKGNRKKHGVSFEEKESRDELPPEYDFDYSKAVRGKYYGRLLAEGANIAVLDPDVAEAFHDSASVNAALRSLLDLTRSTQRLTRRSSGSGKRSDK